MKSLLIVAHTPSVNTRHMADALLNGAQSPDIENVKVIFKSPFDASPEDVLNCDGIILGTTENLGYMSGALKDFFDRIYYPCIEDTVGLPCALMVRAGLDGTGTVRAVKSICTGLKWEWIQEPLVCKGEWNDSFTEECESLGKAVAAGIELGIFSK